MKKINLRVFRMIFLILVFFITIDFVYKYRQHQRIVQSVVFPSPEINVGEYFSFPHYLYSDWQYDQNVILFIRNPGSNTEAFLFDLETREMFELELPNLSLDPSVVHGPNSLIGFGYNSESLGFAIYDLNIREITTIFSGYDGGFSPNGEFLAILRATALFIVNLNSLEEELIFDQNTLSQTGQLSGVVWSPDGRTISFIHSFYESNELTSEVYLYQVEEESVRKILIHNGRLRSLSWSPDQLYILIANTEYLSESLIVFDIERGCVIFDRSFQNLDAAAWSPSGTEMLLHFRSGEFYIIELSDFFDRPLEELGCSPIS